MAWNSSWLYIYFLCMCTYICIENMHPVFTLFQNAFFNRCWNHLHFNFLKWFLWWIFYYRKCRTSKSMGLDIKIWNWESLAWAFSFKVTFPLPQGLSHVPVLTVEVPKDCWPPAPERCLWYQQRSLRFANWPVMFTLATLVWRVLSIRKALTAGVCVFFLSGGTGLIVTVEPGFQGRQERM